MTPTEQKSFDALREALKLAMDNLRPHGDNCFLHDVGEYNSCFCGKDSLVEHLHSVVESAALTAANAVQTQATYAHEGCDSLGTPLSCGKPLCSPKQHHPLCKEYVHPQAQGESRLPERDTNKPAEEQGLFRKFDVTRTDGSSSPGGKHHGCEYFVLDVDHDQHAKAALQAYAVACASTHPQLSADLKERYGAHPQATEPAGYTLVPVEPTPEMLYAIQNDCDILPPRGKRIWAAMLAAAPEAKQ